MSIERRCTSSPIVVEKRDGDKESVSGYCALFYDANDPGTEYQLYRGLKERIAPGAFDRCISQRQDVRGLYNHNPDHLLSRVSSGTLRLSVDKKGLRYSMDLPQTQIGRDVAEMVRRGDLNGASFGFQVVSQRFTNSPPSSNADDDQDDIRELLDLDVMDASIVVFPAYQSASAEMGRMADIPAELRMALDEAKTHTRGVIRYNNAPLIDEDNWDADAAMARVKAWASEGDRTDMAKLARAFTWHDGSSTADGHRMLHHDVRGGKLMVHRGAVQQCMRMLDDDGGGIPEDDRAACKSHLERHVGAWDDPEGDDDEPDDSELEGDDGDTMRAARVEMMRHRLRLAEAG